jgi:hypothetical protein
MCASKGMPRIECSERYLGLEGTKLQGEGGLRKLHTEKLYDLYSSLNIIQAIKSRRMRWARHVARMGDRRGAYRVWWRDQRARDHSEALGADRIILKWIIKEWVGEAWTRLLWVRIGTGGGLR